MQYYNNTQINGTPMPLLMGFTPATRIMEAGNDPRPIYDPISQIIEMDLRIIGTRSLKISSTRVSPSTPNTKTDSKNEIDDQKIVI